MNITVYRKHAEEVDPHEALAMAIIHRAAEDAIEGKGLAAINARHWLRSESFRSLAELLGLTEEAIDRLAGLARGPELESLQQLPLFEVA